MIHQQPAIMKSRSPSLSEDGRKHQIQTNTHAELQTANVDTWRWLVCACSLEVSWWSAGIVFVCVCVCWKHCDSQVKLKKSPGPGLQTSMVIVMTHHGPTCNHTFAHTHSVSRSLSCSFGPTFSYPVQVKPECSPGVAFHMSWKITLLPELLLWDTNKVSFSFESMIELYVSPWSIFISQKKLMYKTCKSRLLVF